MKQLTYWIDHNISDDTIHKAMVVFLVLYLIIGNVCIGFSVYTPEETFNHTLLFTFTTLTLLITVFLFILIKPLRQYSQILYAVSINLLYATYHYNFHQRLGLVSIPLFVVFVIVLIFNKTFWGIVALSVQSFFMNLYYLIFVHKFTMTLSASSYLVNICVTLFVCFSVYLALRIHLNNQAKKQALLEAYDSENQNYKALNQKLTLSEINLSQRIHQLEKNDVLMASLDHKYHTLIEHTSDGVVVYDLSKKTYTFSKRACQLLHMVPSHIEDWSPVIAHMNTEDQEAFANLWHRLIEGISQKETFYNRYQTSDDSVNHLQFTFFPYFEKAKKEGFILVMITDMSESIKALERMSYLSMYDYITDLPNRGEFLKRLNQGLKSSSQGLWCIVLDLKDFRAFNHLKGFDNGNRLLRHIGDALQNTFKESLVSRLYGNTFAIVTDCDSNQESLMDQVQSVVEQIAILNFSTYDLEATVAVEAIPPHSTTSAEAWLTLAEKHIDQLKRPGLG